MFEKIGKFYAGWREKSGTRKRKAFNTARAALLFEAEQKERAHPRSTGGSGTIAELVFAKIAGLAKRRNLYQIGEALIGSAVQLTQAHVADIDEGIKRPGDTHSTRVARSIALRQMLR